jgi:DNA repair exonuclease SbcCD nuclease subunit
MKVLFFSDTHAGLTISGYDTRDILKKALDEILEEIEIWQPDLVIHGGDVFHTSTPKPEDYAMVMEFFSAYDVPTIVLRGNHDDNNGIRADAIEPIRRTKFIGYIKDEVAAEFLMYDSEDEEVMTVSDRVICPELPCKITFNEKELLVFPYIAEARAKRMTGHSAQKLVTDLLKENVNKDIAAAFTHLDIRGVVEGSEASVARGATLLLPKTLAGSCAFPFYCGHLHKRRFF